MPQVLKQVPDLHLLVAGEPYDDAERYREIIDAHGLGERVHWHSDYIPSGDVPLYFSAADLVVQPYVSATQSGVAQIAFHFETPMIVTDVGGLAEVIPHEEAGFVVPPRDTGALADAVARYFTEDWSERLTAGVRRQKERYAPERLAEAIEELL
jgi:glycosyltransferase involved in cell wall biosynthesis